MTYVPILLAFGGGICVGVALVMMRRALHFDRGSIIRFPASGPADALDAVRIGFDHFGYSGPYLETDQELEEGIHEVGQLMEDQGWSLWTLATRAADWIPEDDDPPDADPEWGPGA